MSGIRYPEEFKIEAVKQVTDRGDYQSIDFIVVKVVDLEVPETLVFGTLYHPTSVFVLVYP